MEPRRWFCVASSMGLEEPGSALGLSRAEQGHGAWLQAGPYPRSPTRPPALSLD